MLKVKKKIEKKKLVEEKNNYKMSELKKAIDGCLFNLSLVLVQNVWYFWT